MVPAGPDWTHETKHDGYRLIVLKVKNRQHPALLGCRIFHRHRYGSFRPLVAKKRPR